MLWAVAIFWGTGFVASKYVMDVGITALEFMAARFLTAAVLINIIFFKRVLKLNKQVIVAGGILGVLLFIAFWLQLVGLSMTTPAICGFVTSTCVVMVPFFDYYIYKKKIDWFEGFGAIFMIVGLGFIMLTDKLTINIGTLPSLLGAVCYAIHICYTGISARKNDTVSLTIVMFDVVAVLALIFAFGTDISQGRTPSITPNIIFWFLYNGVICTFLGFLGQTVAQEHVNSTKAAIIMSTEAVFSLIFSILLYKEIVTPKIVVGCTFIFIAMTLSQIKPKFLTDILNKIKLSSKREEA